MSQLKTTRSRNKRRQKKSRAGHHGELATAATSSEGLAPNQDSVEPQAGASQLVHRGVELAKQCSWEGTVAKMQSLIKDAITGPKRRSGGTIEPITETELEYQYMATQGS